MDCIIALMKYSIKYKYKENVSAQESPAAKHHGNTDEPDITLLLKCANRAVCGESSGVITCGGGGNL